MTIEWDNQSQPSIIWDEPEQRDTSLVGQAKELGMNFAGGAQALADMALSVPGLVGAGTAALTTSTGIGDEKLKGQSPTDMLQNIMESSQASDPTQYLPERFQPKDLRATEGYEATNKVLGDALTMVGQGWGNLAALATQGVNQLTGKQYSPTNVGEAVDVGTQLGLLYGGFLGHETPKPGTMEFRQANEPTGVDARKGYGPKYDPDAPLTFQPGPKRQVVKSGTFDKSLTDTDISPIEFDNTLSYRYKNKEITQKLDQWDFRKGSEIPGIDFTSFRLEDPAQIKDLQDKLSERGITASLQETRTLAEQMREKALLADERAIPLSHTISKRIPPTAIPEENVVNGFKQINASPMNKFVELVDTSLMELMRDHDRLTEPKGRNQFLEKENSVMQNGVHKGLTLLYWPEEGRIVQENGNTRRGVAAKHGMAEMPAYVRVMPGKVPEEWSRSAVSIPGLKWEGSKPQGQFAKPSEVGLPSRSLNEGVFDPKIKYATTPTVDTVRLPDGSFQNNHLAAMQWNEMGQWGARKGLSIIKDTSSIPWYKKVAEMLLQDKSFNPNFAIREKNDPGYKPPSEQSGKGGTGGQYRPHDYETSVRKDMVGNEYIFMHETIHAATHSAIQRLIEGKLDRMHPSYDPAKRITELWQTLRTATQLENEGSPGVATGSSPLSKVIEQYGMADKNGVLHDTPHEFIAEAFTNPEFQNLLKQISLPDHLQPKRGFGYYWDAFVQALGDLIGIKRDQNNYLAATLQAGAELMRTSNKQDRMFYALEQHPLSWYPRNVGVEAGNIVDSMSEVKYLSGIDRRPLQEVVGDMKKEDFTDLSDVKSGGMLQRLWGLASISGRNLADARTMKEMLKDTPGIGKVLENVTDKVFLTNRWVRSMIDEAKKGKEFGMGLTRRFVHRLGSRDGIDEVFKNTPQKDMEGMLKKWIASQGSDPLTRKDFANDRQWNAFNIVTNQLQRIHELFNDMRMKLGKPYIEAVNNYFPFERGRGDYRVDVEDMMGNTRYTKMFETTGQADNWAKEMRGKFPYLKVKDAVHREPYQARETDLEVWAEALRINSKNDALTKLIHKASVEALTKQGMGGHLLPRKITGDPIKGFLGDEGNVRDAQRGLHEYIEYAYNYMGNLQKQMIHKEVTELAVEGKSLAEVAPNFNTYINQFMEKAKGSANVYDQSEKIFFGLVGQALGRGASSPVRGTAQLSRFAMVWYLMKTGFFLTQPLQTFNAMPHLMDMTNSTALTSYHFLSGWQRTLFPAEADRAAVNWAIRNQHIDPSTGHLLDEYNTSVPTRLFLKTTGTIEREMVRIPAFLAFEHALRDKIADPIARYEAAADKMAFAMSMTDKANSPLIWEKLGIVGQGMKQLKSYSTNIWGQFAYLVQQAGGKGNFKPLATFMGNQALIGGLKGMVLVPEVTAAIVAFNAMTNSNVSTPSEFLLKHGAPDTLVYGLGSTVMGRDISNQVGNPSGFNYLDPIPFKLAGTIAYQNIEYAVAAAQNQLTDDIRMKTWLANTPPQAHEWIRNWFTGKGQPVPTPGMDMKGRYFRNIDPTTHLDPSAAIGIRSVEESKADDLQRFFKQHEQRLVANKSQIQASMVDDMLTGKGLDPSKIQDYVMAGGDIRNLAQDLKTTMIERSRADIYNQIINKSKSTSHIKAIQEAQPYLNALPQKQQQGTIEWDK